MSNFFPLITKNYQRQKQSSRHFSSLYKHFNMVSCTMRYQLRLVLLLILCVIGNSDTEKDKEECTQSLIGLATCLPYVGGNAPAPTPDCCTGLKQVLKDSKKCLCLLIKDRNDPDLGLQLNVTLALTLPSVCKAPANISECPGKYACF